MMPPRRCVYFGNRPRERVALRKGAGRFARAAVLALAVAGLSAGTASAQKYPAKPIRLVVSFPPGGGADFFARILGQELSTSFGQPIVIENKGGAQGGIAAMFVAKAPPDGYTIWLSQLSILAMNPWVYKDVGYDPIKDFTHITLVTTQPVVITANPRVPASNLKQLAALAKARPDQLTFASSTASTQLAGELFKQLSGTKITHVPYKGGGPAMIDVLGGHVDILYASPPASVPMVKAGKLRAIAVTSATRIAALPDVLSAIESGFPDFIVDSWYSIVAPANTPRDAVATLNVEVGRAMQVASIKDKLLAQGLEPKTNSPGEMTKYVQSEYERWGKVVKAAGIKPE